jgi:hypothetical protein
MSNAEKRKSKGMKFLWLTFLLSKQLKSKFI